jgi:hypothetical protein
MFRYVGLWLGLLTRCLRSHQSLLLENLALRQQLAALKRKHPRPRMGAVDKIFWVFARRFWGAWKQSLVLVNPETGVGGHRAGFRLYWIFLSKARKQGGRKRLSKEVRDLIFRMVAENPTWGAPRVHGELLMLGFEVSERSVSRWMKRAPRDPQPAQPWRAFLVNHTLPTITFGVLYCFFVICHDRRRILHCNITKHPTSSWIIQQLREVFPFATAPRFLIHDRDAKYGTEVPAAIRFLNINAVRTLFASPWQPQAHLSEKRAVDDHLAGEHAKGAHGQISRSR